MKLRKPPYFSLGSAMNMNVRRVRPLFFFTISILIIYVLTTIRQIDEYNDFVIKRPNSFQTVEYTARRKIRKNLKVLNLWTEFDHEKFRYLNRVNGHLRKCPFRCSVTDNPKLLMDSDAVLFHLANIWIPNWKIGTKKTVPFPNASNPNQVWIIHNSDPPFCLFGDVNIFGKIFNWTMWYRSDATIFDPHGRYLHLDEVERDKIRKQYDKRNIYSEKVKFVGGTVSNSIDPASRESLLIDEMSNYIDIEMFDKCYGNRMCVTAWKDGNKDCDNELKKYRFYLAFESNLCKDYITESYWKALDREQIPVVNWKRMDIVTGYVPNSYINVYDFSSVKDVANYIKLVNRNETLYNSYFEWRKNFTIDLTGRRAWCDLCEKLHSMDENYEPQTVDLKKYMDSDVCPTTTDIFHPELKARVNFLARKAAE